MVVNKKNWSPWHHSPPPPAAGAKKFRVKVERIKLEGFEHGTGGGEKVMGVELRWKGERKHGLAAVGFHRRRQELRWCKERTVRKGEVIVWEEDDELENVCLFSETSAIGGEIDGHKFVPWIVTLKLTYGEYMKGKMSKIGKVSLDLAEFVSKIESPVIEKKLPVDLMVSGLTTQATISVLLSFVEIRDSGEFDSESTQLEGTRVVRAKKKQLSLEDVSLSDSDDSVMFDSDATSELLSTTPPSSSVVVNPDITDKKTGIFDWKRRRLNFRPSKTKVEDSRPVTLFSNDSVASGDKYKTLVNNSFQNTWETREFVSRDGESKLITQTFFASFDQRSDKAAGPSACTALVTVMAHWLMSNDSTTMPTVQEFDTLIIDGSSEWRTLCENTTHVAEFPDKHFDLETVLRARIRPLTVSRVKSFVGFFSPEKFDSLTGVMSFDDIWDREISRNLGVYIVSWNDHFFVLKVDEDGYYVIDTLGERLVEGCEQAYILRFDNGSSLTESGTDQVVCKGKECCKGFIKKFLAAIPLKELETEERKQAVPYYSLHHRLQIEFNFCSMV
ncbi:putative NT-type C2 domain-containing protein [Helianthus annuus]|nr:putative NT-type C2 domain-containing protein [Helianthus annuus]